MRYFTPFVLASVLCCSSAMAAETAPLAPGAPAGVRQAQMDWDISPLVYFGAVAVGIGIALAVTNNNSNGATPSSGVGSMTVSTSTTG